MPCIEVRRENDARRAEVPETQKLPCPVDKNGRTDVENSMNLTLERKCFMNLKVALILFIALLYLFPMRCPTLTIIKHCLFIALVLYNLLQTYRFICFWGKFGMVFDSPDEHRKSGIAEFFLIDQVKLGPYKVNTLTGPDFKGPFFRLCTWPWRIATLSLLGTGMTHRNKSRI